MLPWASTKVSNLNASGPPLFSKSTPIILPGFQQYKCAKRIITPDLHIFLWWLIVLLWLGICYGAILFVQIQLDIQGVQPVGLFFQLIFKGKGLGKLCFCVGKLLGGFRL